jgi:hypothetical protein
MHLWEAPIIQLYQYTYLTLILLLLFKLKYSLSDIRYLDVDNPQRSCRLSVVGFFSLAITLGSYWQSSQLY